MSESERSWRVRCDNYSGPGPSSFPQETGSAKPLQVTLSPGGGSVKAFFQNQVLVIMIIMIMMMIIIKIIMTSMTVMIMVIKSNNKNTKCPIDAHFANTSTEENSTLRLKNSSILAFPNSDYFGAKCNFTILSKYIGQFGQIIFFGERHFAIFGQIYFLLDK